MRLRIERSYRTALWSTSAWTGTVRRAWLLTLLFIAGSAITSAQSPRVTLLEEATNAGCPPCAVENPIYEHFLAEPHNSSIAIPVMYHARGPGWDTMNAINPTMHNGRVEYYNLISVPKVVVNGVRMTSPGDTTTVARILDSLRGTLSPITLDVDQRREGNEIVFEVDVASTESLVGKRLRIVVVEGYHFYPTPLAGNNGEEHFHYVAREMLPSHEGRALTIEAGGEERFTERVTLDPRWTGREIYAVAFIQDDETREVLQAATSRGQIAIASEGRSGVRNGVVTEPARWIASATTSQPGMFHLTITERLPPGWRAEARLRGRLLSPRDSVTTEDGVLDSIEVTIIPSETPGAGRVTIGIEGERAAEAHRTFRLYSNRIDALVLIHDSEREESIRALYEEKMPPDLIDAAIVDREDEDLFELNDHHMIILDAGSQPLHAADIDAIKEYLANGGRLFLLGSEIAWGLADPGNRSTEMPNDPDFLTSYLQANYAGGSSATSAVNGIRKDPIGDGLGFLTVSTGNSYPDRITPRKWSRTVFHYGSARDSAAGIRWSDGSYRLVFLTFGLHTVRNDSLRGTILERGITWLLGEDLTGIDEQASVSRTMRLDTRPNPATDHVDLDITLTSPADLTVDLYDALGALVLRHPTLRHESGSTRLRLDIEGLPAGAYSVVVTAANGEVVRAMVVVQ